MVTGGMGGLGEAICIKLSGMGDKVVATYSPGNKKSQEWLAEMKKQGHEFSRRRSRRRRLRIVPAARSTGDRGEVGPVDILVNNAGITRDMTFRKMDKADWDAVMQTNLDSVFNMTKQVIDGMVERGWGRVINVSSVNGQKGAFGQTNYSAAKAGMHGFTKALALEVARKGVTVNTISPGYIGTKMVIAIPKDILDSKILPQIPIGRLGKPEEVAGLSSTCAPRKRRSSPAPTSPSTAASTCTKDLWNNRSASQQRPSRRPMSQLDEHHQEVSRIAGCTTPRRAATSRSPT